MQKANRPTETQAEWLKENFRNFSNEQIADKFKISKAMVSVWFSHIGISKCKKKGYFKESAENRQIKWLNREYSNVTVYQHVERILSMPL